MQSKITDLSDDETINAIVSAARERILSTAQEQIQELEAKLRLVRGTRELEMPKAEPLPEPKPVNLADRVEACLRERVMTLEDLAKTLAEPTGRIAKALTSVKEHIRNVGTSDRPRWTWRIGDDSTSAELNALVRRLISDQPLTTAEIVQATGARPARVNGAIVAIQRSGDRIWDMGTPARGRWFLVPADARDARLAPKGRKL